MTTTDILKERPAPAMREPPLIRWSINLVLALPVVLLYIAHYAGTRPGMVALGFIQYDQAYYMANARELVEHESLGPAYPLPFSADYDNKAIYFQPQVWVLGQLWRIMDIDPAVLLILFGATFCLLAIDMFRRVFDAFIPQAGRWRVPGQLAFIWGGGLLCAASIFSHGIHGTTVRARLESMYALDPGDGWWFLNLGRNLILPFEAYYHYLFFAVLLLLLRQRYMAALPVLALLAFSHPFTGMAALLVILAWAMLEQWYIRASAMPWWFIPAMIAVLVPVGLYYGVWMVRDSEHRILMQQWTLEWLVQAKSFIPAYSLVGLMALLRLRTPSRTLTFLRSPHQRLLVIWAVLNFAFENHEFAVTPHQPAHFTRGYTWSALFLIGAPAVFEILAGRWKRGPSSLRPLIVSGAMLLLLSDNVLWFYGNARLQYRMERGLHASRDQLDVLDELNRSSADRSILLCKDPLLAYFATVYTSFRPYHSHMYNTPWFKERSVHAEHFFHGAVTDPLLQGRLIVVGERDSLPFASLGRARPLYENASYRIWAVNE
ncbi:MAG: hypothetical protein JST66_02530 [Bacteroidetes bacterium]|nr:hypothetical protein [Bacteroidota bacterium]